MSNSNQYWSRFWQQRYSRRQALATGGAGAAGLAGLALVGCGDDDDDDDGNGAGSPTPGGNGEGSPSPSGSGGDITRGGTYVVSQVNPLRDVFDPHTSLFQAALTYSLVGNLAVRGNVDFTELNGELVEEWETPGDGTEITLSVRQGVKWQNKAPTNGRALTAEDVAFNLMRIAGKLDPDNAAAYQRRSTLPNLENAEAVDESTVRVTLSAPHSGFINGLGDWRNTIIPKDFAEAGDFADPAKAIGSGPWIIESFNNEVSARYIPNPEFWDGDGQPYMEALEWVWIPDTNASYASFAQGNISQVAGNTPVARQTIETTAGGAQEYRWVQGQWTHFRFNNQQEQFQNPQVRRAIQLVLDYKTMNDAAYGDGYWNYAGAISIGFPEALTADEIGGRLAFDDGQRDAAIAEAKSLMEAAGHPNGDLTISIMPFQPTGDFFDRAIRAQDDLKEVWPDMNVTVDPPADTTTFSQRQIGGEFDLISYQLFPAPDAVLEMETNFRTDGSRNYGKFSDPDIDAAITAASEELDTEARAEALRGAQEALVDEHVPLIISAIPDQVMFFQEDIRNFENSGRRIGGGNYDLSYETRRFWIDS